ncbi:hypothetical protein PoB_006086800 [Plakobranchus ocellatus]|uniref:Uncharacterized protein n=1 Tax=Plakobranchus ocellatus TaxID=259542 RepID=A0AAV4CR28_9GAST|nr:hypothetical protein PoB_006086800 [Plakobranchus ocellatus]
MGEWEGFGGTVYSDPALRSARTYRSRVRVLPPAFWSDGLSESPRCPFCGWAVSRAAGSSSRHKVPCRFATHRGMSTSNYLYEILYLSESMRSRSQAEFWLGLACSHSFTTTVISGVLGPFWVGLMASSNDSGPVNTKAGIANSSATNFPRGGGPPGSREKRQIVSLTSLCILRLGNSFRFHPEAFSRSSSPILSLLTL